MQGDSVAAVKTLAMLMGPLGKEKKPGGPSPAAKPKNTDASIALGEELGAMCGAEDPKAFGEKLAAWHDARHAWMDDKYEEE